MEKIWLKEYEPNVPSTIDPDQYRSLVDFAEKMIAEYQDAPIFMNMDVTITYQDLDRESKAFATYLKQELHLQKGDRVAIMMPNLLQYPIVMLGILRAGLTVVNVNPLYTARELTYQLNDSGAKALVVLANFAHTVQRALPNIKCKQFIVTNIGDCFPGIKGPLVNFVVKHIKKMVPSWCLPNVKKFKEVIKKGKQMKYVPVDITPDDVAYLQYTGGTTGLAKGAILTHRNMVANVMQVTVWVREYIKAKEDVGLVALPLYHIFSLTIAWCFVGLGALGLMITNPRDLPTFIQTLKKHPLMVFVGINTLYNGLLHHPDIKSVDFSKLKLVIAGGMAMKKAVADRWREVTGSIIHEGYGLTEASPVITVNPLNVEEFTGSIGTPLPSTEVEVRDENRNPLPVGEHGEIWVRGPQVMRGYWNKPEETAKTIDENGWLDTGDVGYLNDKGYVFLVDRKKDMILVSGFNVYPNEVEGVLAAMPGVADVAVIGVPDESSGEKVKAFIVKKDPSITKDAVISYARESLTGYKIPKEVEFRDDLPKTPIGKVLRRELRDEEEKKSHSSTS